MFTQGQSSIGPQRTALLGYPRESAMETCKSSRVAFRLRMVIRDISAAKKQTETGIWKGSHSLLIFMYGVLVEADV